MNTYLFKTQTTMKPYNNKHYWIDSNYIGDYYIKANNVEEALINYVEKVNNAYYGVISKNALKNKQPMYIDTNEGTKQVGYVITGSTDIDKGDYTGFTKQFIDLWIDIKKIEEAF